MNHHGGPRVWQVAVWRGRLRRLIAAGWQALITLRWRLLRRWRMIDPRQGPRDAAHSWRTTARAPRRRHRCTRLVDLANARCLHPLLQTLTLLAIVLSSRPCRLRITLTVSTPNQRDHSFPLHAAAESRCLETDRSSE